jgi:hypothetical protein
VLFLRAGAADTVPRQLFLEYGPIPAGAPPLHAFGALAFFGGETQAAPAVPGGTFEFRTLWSRTGPIDGVTPVQWRVAAADGRTVDQRTRLLGYLAAPPADWQEGLGVRESYRYPLPADLAPGRYTLAVRVGRGDRRALEIPPDAVPVPFAEFTVTAAAR